MINHHILWFIFHFSPPLCACCAAPIWMQIAATLWYALADLCAALCDGGNGALRLVLRIRFRSECTRQSTVRRIWCVCVFIQGSRGDPGAAGPFGPPGLKVSGAADYQPDYIVFCNLCPRWVSASSFLCLCVFPFASVCFLWCIFYFLALTSQRAFARRLFCKPKKQQGYLILP